MKTYLTIVLLTISIFILADNASARSFQGAGGFYLSFYSPDLKFLDDEVQSVTPGFKPIEGYVTTWGGLGYGMVKDRVRLGGYGFGGTKLFSGTAINPSDPTQRFAQDVIFNYGGGGLYFEYVAFDKIKNFETALSMGIGFIGYDIRLSQYDSNVTWDDLMNSLTPGNDRTSFMIDMTNGGFMLHPGIGLKYYITNFFALEATANYLFVVMPDDWWFNDQKVRGMPKIDLSAPSFGLRFMFGG